MKKFISVSVVAGICSLCASSFASAAQQNNSVYGLYRPVPVMQPTYNARPVPVLQKKNENYIGARYMHTFAFFTETQNTGVPGDLGYEVERRGATQMGGNVFGGMRVQNNWVAEAEVGYTGKYSNFDDGFEFSTYAPYIEVNGIYSTDEQDWGWVYGGAGIGAAFPTTSTKGSKFEIGGESKSSVSPLLALMAGYRTHVAKNWFLDLGYKFSAYKGTDIKREWVGKPGIELQVPPGVPGEYYDFTNKLGWFLNHSIQVGLAYEF